MKIPWLVIGAVAVMLDVLHAECRMDRKLVASWGTRGRKDGT